MEFDPIDFLLNQTIKRE